MMKISFSYVCILVLFLVCTNNNKAYAHEDDLRVAILLKEFARNECQWDDFEDFVDELNAAVSLALHTELESGAPPNDALLYPAHQFETDVKETLSDVQVTGLTWQGREGTTDVVEEEDGAEEKDGQRHRQLPGDPFCNYMCDATQMDYWCACACGSTCNRRRLLEEQDDEAMDDTLTDGQDLPQERFLRRKARRGSQSTRVDILRRFRQRNYPKMLWEYEVGQQVAEDFIKRRLTEGEIPCLAWPPDVTVFMARVIT